MNVWNKNNSNNIQSKQKKLKVPQRPLVLRCIQCFCSGTVSQGLSQGRVTKIEDWCRLNLSNDVITKSTIQLTCLNVKKIQKIQIVFANEIRFWLSLTLYMYSQKISLEYDYFWPKTLKFCLIVDNPFLKPYFQVHFQQKQYLWRSLNIGYYWFCRINWWLSGPFHWVLFLWLCYTITRCSLWQSCILFLSY